ncbi:hypothetical protein [Bradyrhizobium sp. CCBAU 65884]|uniref:hypothetical protein n=1 Tax=Bradyrhizobium sp. CCBAU 65884 TaxID=722477 RepID=UPI0023052FEA|nr:hypothetical protein [Bradyrhizobium sp. CCBAU 65884]
MVDQSSEIQSVNYWASAGEGLDPELDEFFADIQREESEKAARLARLSTEIGLPIYPTKTFRLPEEFVSFSDAARKITSSGDWQLAVRLADPRGRIVYRRLGVAVDAAIRAANNYSFDKPLVAVVTPYRESERSGTLWAKEGEVLLELVLGPHYWISKWAPPTQEVLRCRFSPFWISGQYSTANIRHRKLLHDSAASAVRLIFGYSLGQVMTLGLSVYAEFHCHRTIGYRFIECSVSKGWTACRSPRAVVSPLLSQRL